MFYRLYNKALRNSADDLVFLLGDFNRCDVSTLLPNLEQNVTCPTRLNKTLDLCLGNLDGAYVPRSPLGLSRYSPLTKVLPLTKEG